jgi:hypothetical protein
MNCGQKSGVRNPGRKNSRRAAGGHRSCQIYKATFHGDAKISTHSIYRKFPGPERKLKYVNAKAIMIECFLIFFSAFFCC